MLSRLFGSRAPQEHHYAVPVGSRVYVVGDIHGRADLLAKMHGLIRADIDAHRAGRIVVVYLGDYIDRGDASRGVLDMLLDEPIAGAASIHLRGNHEDFMLTFLQDASVGELWLTNGGDATLFSYGVGMPAVADREERHLLMHDDLIAKLPARHLGFLQSLALSHVEGDYVFVHAGVRPGRPLDEQNADDLLWIRDEFLNSRVDFGKCVVHGHSISDDVDFHPNRIGVDTGAYFSGTLSCLVLDGEQRAVLQT